jgi:hypothetical protein
MPKVTFVNEHRIVEVESGRKISDVAAELGIAVCREQFAGTGIGDYTVWVKGPDGCVSAPGFWEKLRGLRGWKRYADKARILGDVEIYTQGGLSDRLRAPRPVAAAPTPKTDPTAARLPVNAAGTAAYPYGNPKAVGKGERDVLPRNTGKPKKAGAAAAAVEDDADDADDEADADE